MSEETKEGNGLLDLRAFKPLHKTLILEDGTKLKVLDLLDLSMEAYTELQSIESNIKSAANFEEQLEVMAKAVREVIPDLTEGQIRKMSMRNLARIVAFIKQNYNNAANPPSLMEDEVPLAESQQTQ